MKNWYWKTFLIVLAMTLLLWIIAIVAAKRFDFYITPNDGVITIIGVVAGFIVIGNYAQVHEMKAELDKKIADVEKRQKENEQLLAETHSQVENFKIITNVIDDLAQNGHTEIQDPES